MMKNKLMAAMLAVGILCTTGAYAEQDEPGVRAGNGLNAQDRYWMNKSAQVNLFEINLGKMAQEMATEDLARKHAQEMVADHTTALEYVREIARKKAIKLPDHPNPDQQVVINYFKHSKSPDWDYDYLEYETWDQKGAIGEIKKEIKYGKDSYVKKLAYKMLPIFEERLRLVIEAKERLRPGSGSPDIGSGDDESLDTQPASGLR